MLDGLGKHTKMINGQSDADHYHPMGDPMEGSEEEHTSVYGSSSTSVYDGSSINSFSLASIPEGDRMEHAPKRRPPRGSSPGPRLCAAVPHPPDDAPPDDVPHGAKEMTMV